MTVGVTSTVHRGIYTDAGTFQAPIIEDGGLPRCRLALFLTPESSDVHVKTGDSSS